MEINTKKENDKIIRIPEKFIRNNIIFYLPKISYNTNKSVYACTCLV